MTAEEKLEAVFGYVQERCLWQFFSRSWDRQENIEGITRAAIDLLTGDMPPRDKPMDKLFYADAKTMVGDMRDRFAWLADEGPDGIRDLMHAVQSRLMDTAVTRSLNHELHHTLY